MPNKKTNLVLKVGPTGNFQMHAAPSTTTGGYILQVKMLKIKDKTTSKTMTT